jgi:hypothetical protein
MPASLSATTPRPLALYTHTKGKQWGLAILAWERGPRRGYQFEDGVLRVFTERHYELIEEVDAPADKAARVIADLRRKLGDAAHHDGSVHTSPAPPDLSFEDQIHLFRSRYPGGFEDRAKGHATPAIAEARTALSAEVLDRALAVDGTAVIIAAATSVLEHTSLLTGHQIQPLRDVSPNRSGHFVQVLRDLLHGEDAYELRFERLVAALSHHRGPAPTWQLVTALPALMWPDQHVCVRPTTFRDQAKWMAPRLVLSNTPSGAMYMRLADMARAVQTSLERAGLAPQDLIDVHQFMVMSLAPAARELLPN